MVIKAQKGREGQDCFNDLKTNKIISKRIGIQCKDFKTCDVIKFHCASSKMHSCILN